MRLEFPKEDEPVGSKMPPCAICVPQEALLMNQFVVALRSLQEVSDQQNMDPSRYTNHCATPVPLPGAK